MSEQILFDNFPLTFLNKDASEDYEDKNEKTYREKIKNIIEDLKSLRIEINEKYSIRSMLEEKLTLLQKEEQTKENNMKYIMNFSEHNIYEREVLNYQKNIAQLKKQIQTSNSKIKLLLEKEFKVRKQLQINYMNLYDILNERIEYIVENYVKHRKCSCAIYAYQQEKKEE
ncbi:conserved Plasmodium protein, unknown function [Plasmodium reichenowi]|uniref:Uncharacterized protein n=1 Tax=Plasmodium reichenowi TaxID=5854 RepID=A0A060RNB9_PLARE|nr:hypothetical protein PRSY57_0304200 [Plasmodium reichenowi]KYO02548.1 hypothetical protein PRSY57_0304200 [Plasmodium reichenowi]CDO62478.1 conserved Plasmodium protein, unknown function [Plasmodium reichenowi]SOV75817.1 conserved Plasmodium protein, unknown function [Plasmodium reichenowi]